MDREHWENGARPKVSSLVQEGHLVKQLLEFFLVKKPSSGQPTTPPWNLMNRFFLIQMMPIIWKRRFLDTFSKNLMSFFWGKCEFSFGGVYLENVWSDRFFPDAGSSPIDGHLLRFAKRAVVVLKKIRHPEERENSEFSKKGGFDLKKDDYSTIDCHSLNMACFFL